MARSKKKAAQERRTIVFVDESGFYLLPMMVRTYSPRGQTPIVRVKLTRDHLSAIGGITQEGRIAHANTRARLESRRRRTIFTSLTPQDLRQVAHYLGWLANPSRECDQNLSLQSNRETGASRAVAWLCS